MSWKRGSIVWRPSGEQSWARHSALQPSPVILDEQRVRVYCGVRDSDGRASITWVDLDHADPTRVLDEADAPVLTPDVSSDAWDRDGVVPTCVVRGDDGTLRMYYAGYERVDDPLIRFRVFAGLAISTDGGVSFERHQANGGQIMLPTPTDQLFGVIHTVLPRAGGGWRAWYGAGGSFQQGASKTLPVYDIRYFESEDGIHFPQTGSVVLGQEGDEYRVGRPFVVDRGAGNLEMYFGASSEASPYRLGFAVSSDDGASWTREDARLGEIARPGTWDAQMSAYPAVIDTPRGRVMFYNGDHYGQAGFGIAYEQ